MIILGIDPGTATTGYGIIKKEQDKIACLDFGCILTSSRETSEKRLLEIYDEVVKLIKKWKPEIVAVETLFFFKNEKTAFSVGQARGVIILAAVKEKKNIFEATPLQVKQAVSGYGKADKSQVQKMVKLLLNLKEIPKPDDAADALAIAITCVNTNKHEL